MSPAAYAMFVLFFVNLVGYLDRQILSLLVQPIKESLHISDGLIGLLQGAAFVVTFAIAGLYIGRLVDRNNRRNLLLVCVLIWTIGAAAGGFAQSAWQLFVARMAVGAGEAALIPCAISLISDFYPSHQRGRALGLFSMGIYCGAGLSLVLVGFAMPSVIDLSGRLAASGIEIAPWRLILVLLLVPGILACLLLSTVAEPSRDPACQANRSESHSGIRDWLQRARVYLPHHVGWAFANVCQYAIAGWFPTVLIREHGYDAKAAGLTYGTLMVVVGISSAYLGGRLADRLARAGGPLRRLYLAPITAAIGGAGFLLLATAHQIPVILAGAAMVASGLGIMMVVGLTSLSELTPPASRGQITSIFLVIITVIGTAGGPAAVGYGNDFFGGASVPLSRVLGIVGMTGACVSILLVLVAIAQIRRFPHLVEFRAADQP
ncbi:hypothetical protein C1T17_08695 [Sphingobium sp. SCG-1]|uniref:MFS transporter n=1 Tax=Sphingobium sp. SCG-1 TaxID=2072936 RepID=UPI000CD6BD30|nr:MFS transporter [Sphingobium sp. SCG-1]AUW58172.1 hypothetical protein C1T17_08695 [Sphingobium sp. SCG-1]